MSKAYQREFGLKHLAAKKYMKNFFKKLAAIAYKFNIAFKRDESPHDQADAGFDFTLDGVCYTIHAKEIPPAVHGEKALQGWEVCGYKTHPASGQHPEEKEDTPIGSDAVAENLVDGVLMAHLKWRIRVEEDGYYFSQEHSGSLEDRRRQAAQAAFEAYAFDFNVAECSGWEHGVDETFRRPVFLEQQEGPSRKITFYVEFKFGSDEIVSQGISE